jgi:hypothetical protein
MMNSSAVISGPPILLWVPRVHAVGVRVLAHRLNDIQDSTVQYSNLVGLCPVCAQCVPSVRGAVSTAVSQVTATGGQGWARTVIPLGIPVPHTHGTHRQRESSGSELARMTCGMNASMSDNYPTSTYPRGSGNHLSYK